MSNVKFGSQSAKIQIFFLKREWLRREMFEFLGCEIPWDSGIKVQVNVNGIQNVLGAAKQKD